MPQYKKAIPKRQLFEMDEDEYHKLCYLSQSGLKTFMKSPWHYANDASGYITTDAMRLGTALHAAILEPHKIKENYVVRPLEFNAYRSNAAKAWRKEVEDSGKIAITPEEYGRLSDSLSNIHIDHYTNLIFNKHGDKLRREMSGVFSYRGHWFKMRTDALLRLGNTVYMVDLKRYGKPDITVKDCSYTIKDYGYHVQMFLYKKALEQMPEFKGCKIVPLIAFFQDKKDMPITPFTVGLSDDVYEEASLFVNNAIDYLEHFNKTGYPTPAEWMQISKDGETNEINLPIIDKEHWKSDLNQSWRNDL